MQVTEHKDFFKNNEATLSALGIQEPAPINLSGPFEARSRPTTPERRVVSPRERPESRRRPDRTPPLSPEPVAAKVESPAEDEEDEKAPHESAPNPDVYMGLPTDQRQQAFLLYFDPPDQLDQTQDELHQAATDYWNSRERDENREIVFDDSVMPWEKQQITEMQVLNKADRGGHFGDLSARERAVVEGIPE